MLSSPALCPLCEQNIDIFGDHALCCRKVRDLIVRHNRVRNWVFKLADQGLLSPEIEKKVLGPTDISKRRPGDVAIPLWSGGKGLAIDVAVTCPVAAHNISIEAPCEHYALHQKYAKYGAAFKGSSFLRCNGVRVQWCQRGRHLSASSSSDSPRRGSGWRILVSLAARGHAFLAAYNSVVAELPVLSEIDSS